MKVSVVIPCYNSAKMISDVVDAVIQALSKYGYQDYEIILVNDGSHDDTFKVIQDMCDKNDKIIGLDMATNFGQATAKIVGTRYIKGEYAVFMDDDGQHPAEQINLLLDKLADGNDIVFAHFPHKEHTFIKRVLSSINTKILEMVGIGRKGIVMTSYYAINAMCIDALKMYASPFPNQESYLMRIAKNVCNVDIEHNARIDGKSGYSLKKTLEAILSVITNFSFGPIRVASLLGMFSAFMGFLYGFVLIINKIVKNVQIVKKYIVNILFL